MGIPKVGDALPEVTLYEGTPLSQIRDGEQPVKPVKLRDVFDGKKGILVNVPGAYTPGCSKTHLPGYVANLDKYKEAGADVIVFTAANDPYVLTEWGVANGAYGKILFLADIHNELAQTFDAVLDATSFLGSKRGKRYSMVIKNNVITHFNLDEGLSCSLAEPTLAQLREVP